MQTSAMIFRAAVKELIEAADEMIAFIPGHWHDDHTIRLKDAAEDACKAMRVVEQDDLYPCDDPVMQAEVIATIAAYREARGRSDGVYDESSVERSELYDLEDRLAALYKRNISTVTPPSET